MNQRYQVWSIFCPVIITLTFLSLGVEHAKDGESYVRREFARLCIRCRVCIFRTLNSQPMGNKERSHELGVLTADIEGMEIRRLR